VHRKKEEYATTSSHLDSDFISRLLRENVDKLKKNKKKKVVGRYLGYTRCWRYSSA